MKIAEGLLLRKHLEAKVEQLKPLKLNGEKGIFEISTTRKAVNENVDEVTTQIPKVTLKEVTKEFDYYSSELRKLDGAIQKANWVFDLDFKESAKPVEKKEEKK